MAVGKFDKGTAGWAFILNYPRPVSKDGDLDVLGKTENQRYNFGVERSLNLTTATATVLQIEADAASATASTVNFTTELAPDMKSFKSVTFGLQPGRHLYTVDMRGFRARKDTISTLRFSFLGAKEGDKAKIALIKILNGEKIPTPLAYTPRKSADSAPLARFRFGSIFGEGMVLQRQVPLPIWGDARPGERVTVTLRSPSASTVADAPGEWRVELNPESVGAPSTLSATGDKKAKPLVSAMCSSATCGCAASNPIWVRARCISRFPTTSAKNSSTRSLLTFVLCSWRGSPARVLSRTISWRTPLSLRADAKTISAVSYFFGREGQATQHIPIDLIYLIAAGTQIEQWMSPAAIAATYNPDELRNKNIFGRSPSSGLYNGMLAPILPYPVRGAIWYQGDLHPPESWAYILQAQLETTRKLKDVTLAVTVDLGAKKNLHSSNKYPVGHRLALAVRATVYGEKIEYSGPVCDTMRISGSDAILAFSHADGLSAPGATVTGFEISEDGQIFVPAQATAINGATVTVSNPKVSRRRRALRLAQLARRQSGQRGPIACRTVSRQKVAQNAGKEVRGFATRVGHVLE